jgi:hypothetical protein
MFVLISKIAFSQNRHFVGHVMYVALMFDMINVIIATEINHLDMID